MRERIYIYDRARNIVNDPERSHEYATRLRWESIWPGGYGPASWTVPREIAVQWLVKNAYEVKVYDGARIVYQGELSNLNRAMRADRQTVEVQALGFYSQLTQNRLRKRWVDNAVISRLAWPVSNVADANQNEIESTKRDNILLIRAGYGDILRAAGDSYREQYDNPAGNIIYRVESSYAMRSGEGITIRYTNVAGGTAEASVTDSSGVVVTGTLNATLAGGDTEQLQVFFVLTASDLYDENDWGQVRDLTIKNKYNASHSAYATPTYTASEIVEDVLLEAAPGGISTDFSLIADNTRVLTPFMTKADSYETADGILRRVGSFGDASDRPWGVSVWDETGATDGKARAEFTYRDTTTYDYVTTLEELSDFSDEESLDELYNYIIVRYVDSSDREQYYTPDDTATLTDAASVSRYGRRDYILDIGNGDTTRAGHIGRRFLDYHATPLRKSSLSQVGTIRTEAGVRVPVNRVRAGQRVKLLDYGGGVTYFLRRTGYDAAELRLDMEPDLPPDSLELYFARRDAEMET